VFATVGFGDDTAKTEAARLMVTGQMIIDLVPGPGARVISGGHSWLARDGRSAPNVRTSGSTYALCPGGGLK
jgi:hypothetical protein